AGSSKRAAVLMALGCTGARNQLATSSQQPPPAAPPCPRDRHERAPQTSGECLVHTGQLVPVLFVPGLCTSDLVLDVTRMKEEERRGGEARELEM
ncbi:hypothetical protein KUCAC02_011184, partial [Chaenocephalus aceratus]